MRRGLASLLLTTVALTACSSGGSPGSSAGASAAASPLPAGTYTSRTFQPTVTVTLPTGWDLPGDSTALYQIAPAGSDAGGIYVFRDPAPAAQSA
ncbi:MAG TPA: hypothetical protein VEY67_10810, partial [Candidatus Dormibacteraeota bacterium]|nr:hypothetical protein [Candidatus Dormibacteraeota bacterium]